VANLVNANAAGSEQEYSYFANQAETFRRRYIDVKMDLVIAYSPLALSFASEYHDKMCPGVPVIFSGVGTKEFEGRAWPGIDTGVTLPVGIGETIDLALRLNPGTQTVTVFSGPDTFWLRVTHTELLRRKLREIYLIESPGHDLLKEADALPPHTVVLVHHSPSSNGPDSDDWDLLDAVAQRWPTYSAWPGNCLNHGCIGGAFQDGSKESFETADIAARVLSGERPGNIPVVHDKSLQVTVDWRALHRWHIPESALPAGSVILYRPPTIWQQYRKYISIATVMIVLLALLILGLLWQRARKRRAEAGLGESEKRFRVMADTTPALIWMCDAEGMITYLNDRRVAFTGRDPRAGFDDTWTTYIHPDDRNKVQDQQTQALREKRPFSKEYRLRRSDGVYRWMLDIAAPRIDGHGAFAGFIGSAIDVADQKLAQQALERVSGQLIEAQEKERTRIARDIHDDICQRLVLLSMELEQANRPANVTAEGKKNLAEIRKHCSGIVGDLRSLSHELHSSTLDYLGLVPAIRGFCQEIAKQHHVTIELTEKDVPPQLSRDISLCLFRVSQEALHNAVKYSGAKQFKVDVRSFADEIQLQVDDGGVGFDINEAKRKGGLGLVSMQERINQMHGKLIVTSTPGTGTSILAAVPIAFDEVIPVEEGIERDVKTTDKEITSTVEVR
jgi:PAS domain S-box-containing protein